LVGFGIAYVLEESDFEHGIRHVPDLTGHGREDRDAACGLLHVCRRHPANPLTENVVARPANRPQQAPSVEASQLLRGPMFHLAPLIDGLIATHFTRLGPEP